jgi:hypothetical protein
MSFKKWISLALSFVMAVQFSHVLANEKPTPLNSASNSTPLLSTQSNQSDKSQMFLSTESVPSEKGPVRIEAAVFRVSNEADLNAAKEVIIGQLKYRPETNELFKIEVQAPNHVATGLDRKLAETVGDTEDMVQALEKLEPQKIDVESVSSSFFRRHYNLTLGFVRFITNTGTVSMGLVTGKGVPLEHALMIGALAGAISGGLQVKSDAVFKWLSNSVMLVNSAKKLKLINPEAGLSPSRSEKILREVETYSKWALLETGFLLAVHTAMGLLSIPVAENLISTVAKSTLSQGVFEVGVLRAAEQLEQMNPKWSQRASVFKNVSIFTGSSLSVLAAIGSMIGMPYANLGFVVLTATGLVLNFGSKIIVSEKGQKLLNLWAERRNRRIVVPSCRNLMNSI